jgi:excisionase family DNA binding protein
VSSAIEPPTTFYRPAEVARLLRCSEWWVKEQARRRRIPYLRVGGRYLFTAEHIAEIVQRFEVRPVEHTSTVVAPAVPRTRRPTSDDGHPVVRLTARVPRRARRGSEAA